jgi:hypothetical protein
MLISYTVCYIESIMSKYKIGDWFLGEDRISQFQIQVTSITEYKDTFIYYFYWEEASVNHGWEYIEEDLDKELTPAIMTTDRGRRNCVVPRDSI